MARRIDRAAVLGAGVMGSGIAAHLANAGIPCLLLDIVPPNLTDDEKTKPEARNRFALNGIDAAKKFKPAPLFYHEKFAALVTPGNFDDDLEKIADCDIVIEVVVENLDIKRKLFDRLQPHLKYGAIVSSNTSGLSIAKMTDGYPDSFKQNFLVTHFFNPVRFMKLLEIVPGPDTDPEVLDTWVKFGSDILGKGIVFGKDTPNFVANRIGVYSIDKVIQLMMEGDYTIEEIDAIFGKPMGRPSSAAFKTCDLVGLDTFKHVSQNCYDSLPDDDERDVFTLPSFVGAMIERKLLGGKTKAGFYKKGEAKEKLVIDYKTVEYRPVAKPDFESVKSTKGVSDAGERIRNLLNGSDRAAAIAWKATAYALIYAAKRIGEIADDVVNIDNGMKWGFNWDLGPFETWDAIGVADSVARMEADGFKVPDVVKRVLTEGEGTFYKKVGSQRYYFDFGTGRYQPIELPKNVYLLGDFKEEGKVVKDNFGASLIDIGDGVLCLEFHTKMNAIDDDILNMMNDALDELEGNPDRVGMVVANHADNFSVGANIAMVLMAAQMGNWDMLEQVVRQLQGGGQRMKYCKKPVITCPAGMTLGGGCEISLHGARIQAAAELYMGLVEVGVGVIPAGGGCKETVCRVLRGVPADMVTPRTPFIQKAFEQIALAKVSRSAEEARGLMYLRPEDGVSLAREKQIGQAKEVALGLARAGYRPPVPPDNLILPGRNGSALFEAGLLQFNAGGFATDHDVTVGRYVAKILCGGDIQPNSKVTEQHLLDLECESFLALCGMEKTQARIEYMLKNGKPLRN
ncbi:MAG: 3-hydroxyacyl-CoA dehydrogenase/enoyl-CoA hydratase family protein [Deltaproteobacteria bacterium]|nr:3-hydroxyacyl-CoA dehydrogenase/enoyl-CoA hydratase family protein [Deltaproteobacteria bacterium]